MINNRNFNESELGYCMNACHPLKSDQSSRSRRPAFWLIALGLFLSFSGCSGSSSVPATSRNSDFQPVFGSTKAEAVVANHAVDLAFVNRNQFACFSINVESLRKNPELGDVTWDAIERSLTDYLGTDNGTLDRISRVWVLMDRSGMEFDFQNPVNPIALVFEYRSSPNFESMDQANLLRQANADKAVSTEKTTQPDGNEPASRPPLSLASRIADNRIAFGSPSITAGLARSEPEPSDLLDQLHQLTFTNDIEGVISIAPIRDLLTTMASTISRFGGENAAELAQLPKVIQQTVIQVSLTDETLFKMNIGIDDEPLIRTVTEMLNQSGTSPLPLNMIPNMSMLAGQSQKNQQVMITPTTPEIAAEIGKDIQSRDLFRIEAKPGGIELRLQRPKDFSQLVKAAITDTQQQLKLVQRISHMKQIAAAMQDYHRQYKQLPPAGLVTDDSAGLPLQFNWRVGLLPFVGQQELYSEFRFEEPWDSVHNQEVAQRIPDIFASEPGETPSCLFLLGGEGTVYPGPEPIAFADMQDKPDHTAVIFEATDTAAKNWIDPQSTISGDDPEMLGKQGENGILFVNAAFKVQSVLRSSGSLKSVLTASGDDSISRNDFIRLPDEF